MIKNFNFFYFLNLFSNKRCCFFIVLLQKHLITILEEKKIWIFHSNKYCKMLLRLENEIFWLCYCSMKRIYCILCCYLQVFVIISLKYSSQHVRNHIVLHCYFNTDPLFTLFYFYTWIFLFQKRKNNNTV